jgi:hypothetical protein
MIRLTAFCRWLGEGRTVWVTILVVATALGLTYLLAGNLEARIRNWGLILQLMGIVSVAVGVQETLELFGRPRKDTGECVAGAVDPAIDLVTQLSLNFQLMPAMASG